MDKCDIYSIYDRLNECKRQVAVMNDFVFSGLKRIDKIECSLRYVVDSVLNFGKDVIIDKQSDCESDDSYIYMDDVFDDEGCEIIVSDDDILDLLK